MPVRILKTGLDAGDHDTITATFTADGAITKGDWVKLVVTDTERKTVAQGAAVSTVIGVAAEDADDGAELQVIIGGYAPTIKVGAAVAAGAGLEASAAGAAITHTASAGLPVLGFAITALGLAGTTDGYVFHRAVAI